MSQFKACHRCGDTYRRNPKFDVQQWATSRFCSVDCSNKARRTHMMRRTRLYRVWAGVKNRCLNDRDHLYQEYGARGITIFHQWRDDFALFAAAVGPDPGPAFDLGRIDNDRGYEPGNVQWETRSQNLRNTRATHWVEYNGSRLSLIALCEQVRAPYKRTWQRLKAGWPLDRAIQP